MNICEIDMNLVRWSKDGNVYLIADSNIGSEEFVCELLMRFSDGTFSRTGQLKTFKTGELYKDIIYSEREYQKAMILSNRHAELENENIKLDKEIKDKKRMIEKCDASIKRSKFINDLDFDDRRDSIVNHLSGNYEYIVSRLYVYDSTISYDSSDKSLRSIMITSDFNGKYSISIGRYRDDTGGTFINDCKCAKDAETAKQFLIDNFSNIIAPTKQDYNELSISFEKIGLPLPADIHEKFVNMEIKSYEEAIASCKNNLLKYSNEIESLKSKLTKGN